MLDLVSRETRQKEAFRKDVLEGLGAARKVLPSRWLYDDRGCDLFEQITTLPEYYPTRTETAILRRDAGDIGAFLGGGALLEYGAGAGVKSRIVLEAARPQVYVPIDIAGDFLELTAQRLRADFPAMATWPVTADFTQDFDLPRDLGTPRSAFFPGSTIGNLDALQAHALLLRMRLHVGEGGRAVIGIDLRKRLDVLLAAYDDAQGVTAAFNLNLLTRINRELAGTIDPACFIHEARWNPQESAIEMHLRCLRPHQAQVAGRAFTFAADETIHTESSRKYDLPAFAIAAGQAGWSVEQVWTDPQDWFALVGLAA